MFRRSSVSIVNRPQNVDRGSILDRGRKLFSSPRRQDRLWGPPSLLYSGYWGFSPGMKRPGREADHCPSSAEVKNVGSYTSNSPTHLRGVVLRSKGYIFMAWYFVKHKDNFYLTLLQQTVSTFLCLVSTNPHKI
jgi:hypothetical protein